MVDLPYLTKTYEKKTKQETWLFYSIEMEAFSSKTGTCIKYNRRQQNGNFLCIKNGIYKA